MSMVFPLKLKGIGSYQLALLSLFCTVGLAATNLMAQNVPDAINYQAIIRDSQTFLPVSDQATYISVEFLDGPNGNVVYHEEFTSVQTGKAGLVNLSLGRGEPLISSFSAISWESASVWLRLSVDVGNGLAILQETPFQTVPYAFYANKSGGSDGDNDPTNELIESATLQNGNLSIEEGGQTLTVDLNSLINDADADPTNEIQSLVLTETTLSITGNETAIDLSQLPGIGGDDDSDPSNELQELELENNILSISNSLNGSEVDLSPYLDNTDEQDLNLTGSTLSLSGDLTPVDLSALPGLGDDADADPSNEIQDLSLSGSTLSLSGDGTTVDLSTLPGLGDDADADPENELQNIQLSGDNLSLTGVSPAAIVDLSPYDQSNLTDGHIFVGNGSDEASEIPVFGDLSLAGTGEITVEGLRGRSISSNPPSDGQILIYSAANSEWQPRTSAAVTSAGSTAYYSIDPLDFVEIADEDEDLGDHNALKFYNSDAPFAMVLDKDITHIGAPIHLPHNAVITRFKVSFRNSASGTFRFTLFRKDMTNFSLTNEVLESSVANGGLGNHELGTEVSNNNVVDNSRYSYRLLVRFSSLEPDDSPDIDDIEQVLYGAVIEYTTN